ncbi:MAG: hypothetical protein ACI90V_011984, partial [Bacillariaceae sp.]
TTFNSLVDARRQIVLYCISDPMNETKPLIFLFLTLYSADSLKGQHKL